MTDKARTILVVDDTPDMLMTISLLLRKEGFRVLTARGGMEALETAADKSPDLVLLDALMPDIDGFTTCARLKAGAKTKSIPVIMLTAVNQIKDVEKAYESGAGDFVPKPFDTGRLLAKIRQALAGD